MELLLKKERGGRIVQGSDEALLQRARQGDDLTLFIESSDYDESIVFNSYVVSGDRVHGLSLAHLDHGHLPDPLALPAATLTTAQYIYDSRCHNVLVKSDLKETFTLTQIFLQNPVYRTYTWYSSRRYHAARSTTLDSLKACGDQFKVRLELADSWQMVIRPDIIYFPYEKKEYLVKSAALLLPVALAADPPGYARRGVPLVESDQYCHAYVNVGSDGWNTLVHKMLCSVERDAANPIREGKLPRSGAGVTQVTRFHGSHTLVVPEEAYTPTDPTP